MTSDIDKDGSGTIDLTKILVKKEWQKRRGML
jgi:hypothetical protein